MKKMIFMILLASTLAACSVSTDANPFELPAPAKTSTPLEPTLSCNRTDAANGKLANVSWYFKSGVAFPSALTGLWDVTLYDVPVQDPCRQFGDARGIKLMVPKATGSFDLENEKAAVFYDMNKNPQFSQYTSNGRGTVDSFTSSVLRGSFEAYVDEATGVCGQFEVTICQ